MTHVSRYHEIDVSKPMAGLRYEKRALLLGLLVDAAERMRADVAERERLTAIGARAFGHEGK